MPLKADRYAVIGNPIAHSKSPLIHRLFAEQTQQYLDYQAVLVPLGEFESRVGELFAQGLRGCNVTIPFKQNAWAIAHERSSYAQIAGALNTLMLCPDQSIYGHNTDGLGMMRDLLVNKRVTIQGKKVLVLGAGGAVRGIIQPLLEAQPALVQLANRTALTASELVQDFKSFGEINGGGFDSISGSFDLVINGTAASLQGAMPDLPSSCIVEGAVCYDMMYAKEPTPFMRWAYEQRAGQVFDGLGMLIEQAAEAFQLWRGIRPDTAPVFAALRPI
ncbi:shikimate dehydrogenase [uncultured Thiothrix sp.]|jgi:shikimate dehydrogenase|uniref:shikimate dehydrogenase n=1 Tax=uncultured Thiothrix sp. TaxID=223185 RepID=UPI0026374584|nr:shikimate dehydrogenase [uncultured Thiothrix sp.]HMT93604.1 shikimate dehydrogenase [Thiolinea sp.]